MGKQSKILRKRQWFKEVSAMQQIFLSTVLGIALKGIRSVDGILRKKYRDRWQKMMRKSNLATAFSEGKVIYFLRRKEKMEPVTTEKGFKKW